MDKYITGYRRGDKKAACGQGPYTIGTGGLSLCKR